MKCIAIYLLFLGILGVIKISKKTKKPMINIRLIRCFFLSWIHITAKFADTLYGTSNNMVLLSYLLCKVELINLKYKRAKNRLKLTKNISILGCFCYHSFILRPNAHFW